MRDFLRLVDKRLAAHLGEETRRVSTEIAGRMLERRYDALRERFPSMPSHDRDPRAPGLVMSALYRMSARDRDAWIVSRVGGPPCTAREHLRAEWLVLPMRSRHRWEELTVHLGEWLIVLTEDLPKVLPRATQIVATICYEAGVAYAEQMRALYGLAEGGDEAAHAIEVLRISEYLFRVNPEHWHETDPAASTGYLEGTACPWYSRPGWQRMHCGIFGQFQAGIASVFGLRYQLTRTIPKHGGHTCRIDLVPLSSLRARA
jgi:hypothetical protein